MKKQRASQLVEAAVWLEATGDLAGARKLYEQALKMDPENARAKQALQRGEGRPPPRMTPPKPMPAMPAVRATPVPPPPPEPKMTPAPPLLPPEPKWTPEPKRTPEAKRTLIQYESLHDTLPPVDPELEEQATVVDMSLQQPVPSDDQVAPDHPTLPGFARPDIDLGPKQAPPPFPDDPEPKTPARPPPPPLPPDPPPQAPSDQRRYLEVDWSALRTPDPSSAPTPPWIPKEVLTGELDLAPPPSKVPPNMSRRKRPPPPPADPTPPPRNAWEEDGTMPGVDLSPVLTPPRTRDAMDLLSDLPPRATPPPVLKKPENVRVEVESLIKGARDLLELDDHTGAMDLIEKAAQLAPDDPMVQRLKTNSEVVLQSMYESKLGRLDARPRLLLRADEIIWLNLDHRAGFVLAQIDGSVTFEDLMAICGMSRLDTLRILAQLVGAGVISPSYGG